MFGADARSGARASSGSAGSMSALWKAWLVRSRSTRTPPASKSSISAATASSGPLTTWCAPLSAASDTDPRTAAATRSEGANTAAIAPPPGSDPITAPRRVAKRMPSSNSNTPAARAAAISPTLCPNTASGRIPTLPQSAVSAHSSAYSAGCVHSVRSSRPLPPSASPNIAASRDSPRSSRKTSSHRSSTSRATGSLSCSSRPMPNHWLPCPV